MNGWRPAVRVGLVIGQLTHGGAERQCYELAVRLGARGYRPVVFCLSEAEEPYGPLLRRAGVRVCCLPRRRRFEWRRVGRLAQELARARVDLVHAFLFVANAYGYFAARRAGLPAFLPSIRNMESRRPRLFQAVDRRVLARSPVILVNSPDLAGWVARRYGVERSSLRVVPNGLDLSRFAGIAPPPVSGRQGTVVGSLSLFKEQKRIPFILEMARRLLRTHPDARFRLVGGGPLRERMLGLRDRMGLAGQVEMPGATEDVPGELAGFDLFLLASDREGMPNAVLEAMAAARPVVASDVAGTSSVVCHQKTGLLFPAADCAAGVEQLARLIDDPAAAARLGQRARDEVREHYSVERMVERTVAVYEEVLALRPAAEAGA
ncbi:MAG: glycosyltransferase [Acidobacteriota bacterium]